MRIEIFEKHMNVTSKSGKTYFIGLSVFSNKNITIEKPKEYPMIYFEKGSVNISLDDYLSIDLVADEERTFLTLNEYNYKQGKYFYRIFELKNKNWIEMNNGIREC